MNRWIQFLLLAMFALCLNFLSAAQTKAPPDTSMGSPTLQAFDRAPDLTPMADSANPQANQGSGCWSETTLESSGSPELLFKQVSLTARVNMNAFCRGRLGNYTGRIVFYDYDTVIATLDSNLGATLYTTSLAAGTHHIKATFISNDFYRSSSAALRQDIIKWPAPLTLTANTNTSIYGQDVIFTATLTSDIEQWPTGKIRFSDGTKAIGIAIVNETGVATFTKKNLAVGTHSITAEYYGDAISAKSAGAAVTVVVSSTTPTASSASLK